MDAGQIESIYPVSPVQEAALASIINADEPTPSGQLSCLLRGRVCAAAFERAWRQVVNRYPVLRASFIWKQLGRPHQVVHKGLKLSLQQEDWTSLADREQQARLRKYLQDERDRRFDPMAPPLMRLSLIRTTEDTIHLSWTCHLLLIDGLSLAVLLREILAYHQAFILGNSLQLQQPRPYQEYVTWLKHQEVSAAETYWRQAMAKFDSPTLLELPSQPINLFDGPKIHEEEFRLTADEAATIEVFARNYQVGRGTIVMAAWAFLLSVHSGMDEVFFGSLLSGRPPSMEGVMSMVGPFANTLPVCARIAVDRPVIAWLNELQERRNYLAQNPHHSVLQIREWSRLPHDLPLFESVLDLETIPAADSLADLSDEIEVVEMRIQRPDSPSLLIEQLSEALPAFRVSYDARRFDNLYFKRILGQFRNLIVEIARDADRPLSNLSLLTGPERQQALIEWNDTATPVRLDRHLCAYADLVAAASPDAVALCADDNHLSYAALHRRANQLAHLLSTLGAGPELPIAICLPRSLDLFISQLAVLKVGAAFLPLDPQYPIDRLLLTLEDARAPLLLTSAAVRDELPPLHCYVVCLDADQHSIDRQPGHYRAAPTLPDHLAYVIYTSGSTGRPKGVQITHRALLNLCAWHQERFAVTGADRATQLASPAFDAAVWEVWPYLLCGASLHLASEVDRAQSERLLQWLRREQITISFAPTPVAERLLELEWNDGAALRILLTGGDRLGRGVSKELGFKVVNNYGPTETTVVATSGEVAEESGEGAPAIGRAIDNIEVYVVDGGARAVGVGMTGELWIGGEGVGRGYVNDPWQTAERFAPDGMSGREGRRLYRTGDLARYGASGDVEFVGRIDHQVKVRGYRIELGEVEAALRRVEGVREAVVVMGEGSRGEKRLVGYVVWEEGRERGWEDVRRILGEKLPEYMAPAVYVRLDRLPLTTRGKVDRRALPAPDQVQTAFQDLCVEPRTLAESTLAKIWGQVLGLDQVNIYSNFFEAGGDSILGVQIIARANQAGIRLTTKQLFLHPTIAELASVAGTTALTHAEQEEITGSLPLTPIQRWFFERDFPVPHHYNQSMILEVREKTAPIAVELGIDRLIRHHDALRLRFVRYPTEWQQFNSALDEITPLCLVNLSAVPEAMGVQTMTAVATRLQMSLDLERGPLIRAALFDYGASRPYHLLIILHHLAVDGVSWRILLEDLQTICRQASAGEPLQLPPKTTSFRYWAQRLAEYAQSEELRVELPYWLDDARVRAPALPIDYLPTDHHEDGNCVASMRCVSLSLGVEETEALLQEVPSVYHTKINDALLAALTLAFGEWTGERRLLIELEGHGREPLFSDADPSRTVGWFTSLFPVYLELSEDDDPGEALKSVKEQLRQLPNHGVGYGLLRYLSGDPFVAEKLRSQPLSEVSFNYLGRFDQEMTESSAFRPVREHCGPTRHSGAKRTHLIDINGCVIGGQLHFDWLYSENIHRRTTIDRLAQSFMGALRSIISHCQAPEAGGYTPSDVADFGWNREDLNQIVASISGDL